MISNFVLYAACNYPESHWFTSHPAWPDSPQIVYWYRYPGSDLILVVQTWLYYISYSSPFIQCVLRLLLGKICKAVEFDPSQNKLRCTVLAVLSSRAIQQLEEAMLCWLDLRAHLTTLTQWTSIPMHHRENWKSACFCKCALCETVHKNSPSGNAALHKYSYINGLYVRVPYEKLWGCPLLNAEQRRSLSSAHSFPFRWWKQQQQAGWIWVLDA